MTRCKSTKQFILNLFIVPSENCKTSTRYFPVVVLLNIKYVWNTNLLKQIGRKGTYRKNYDLVANSSSMNGVTWYKKQRLHTRTGFTWPYRGNGTELELHRAQKTCNYKEIHYQCFNTESTNICTCTRKMCIILMGINKLSLLRIASSLMSVQQVQKLTADRMQQVW